MSFIANISNILKRPIGAIFLCFIAGSLSAFAMAPYLLWPLLFVGVSVLYWALTKAESGWQGFWRAAAFGLGYFIFSLSWIGNALLVENNPYAWAYPLAVCGLPALLCLFFGLAGYVAVRFLDLTRVSGYIGFVALLSLTEWLRGHVFTGFPWNLFGYTWEGWLEIAQVAAIESVYLLTTLTILWAGVGGFLLVGKGRRDKIILGALVLASFAASYGFGAWRMVQPMGVHEDTIIRIVQPNTPQHEKWQRGKMFRHFETALELSQQEKPAANTIIIWPETALSPRFLATPYVMEQISGVLKGYDGDAALITGALRHESAPDRYYNSIISIDESGGVSNIYDKSHLVPFGEYIPFQRYIPLPTVTQFTGFERGDGPQVHESLGGLKYISQICYEILFPNRTPLGADFIVNVTNDAWYGDSAGPYQHLAKAKFRAIESGIPVIRAANTGVSAMIDPLGRIMEHQSDLFTKDAISVQLPTKFASHSQKSYYNHVIYVAFLCLALILAFVYPRYFKR
ncbi:MAG: apolipoprotein N-acyltransferase [Alphaproteobacteria bacterium]